jgi:hypothetical protein
MFERSEFARLPPGASIAGCPGNAGVTDTRVAFLLGTFLWRSKEKYLARRGETRLVTIAKSSPKRRENRNE